MFCQKCGKTILSDSIFCTYCGASVSTPDCSVDIERGVNTPPSEEKDYSSLAKKYADHRLRKISRITCYITFPLFLTLFIFMAPGVGSASFFYYLVGASIALALFILFMKKANQSESALFFRTALIVSCSILILSISLCTIYGIKLSSYKTRIPTNGTVHMKLITDDDCFVQIDNEWYSSGDVITVKPGASYPAKVCLGSESSNKNTQTITPFIERNIKNGFTVRCEIDTSPFYYRIVFLKFERVCDFWEVVFG